MMKLRRLALAGAFIAAICASAAYAAGLFSALPSLPSGGETAFSGTETVPFDTGLASGVAPQSGTLTLGQLGNGLITVNTTAGNQTIPNNTSWFVENVGNTSPVFTLPAAPVHGQIQHIALATAQTTNFQVTNNTGQTCLPACPQTITTVAAGSGFGFVFDAVNTRWIRIY